MFKVLIRVSVLLMMFQQAIALPSDSLVARGDSCFALIDYDCALSLYSKALEFSHGDSSVVTYVIVNRKIADIYYQLGEFRDAYVLYKEVIPLAGENDLMYENAKALEGLSHILWRYGDNIKSISSILESIRLFKALGDTTAVVSSSNILAGIYTSRGEIDKAKDIYTETLNLAIASNDSVGMASSYEYLGVAQFFKNQFEKAIQFYSQSIEINRSIGNNLEVGITNANIGEAYNALGQYNTAMVHFDIAKDIMMQHDFKSGLIFVNYSIGVSLCGMNRFDHALDRYEESLRLIEITGEEREKPQVLMLMSDCYSQFGDYKSAYDVHQKYTHIKDSLEQINRNKELMDIMARYEVDKKEQENRMLSIENQNKIQELEDKETIIFQQKAFAVILMGFLLLSFYLYYKLNINRQRLLQANKTKDKLFGFVAHDLKAPMANIQMLIDLLKTDVPEENEELTETVDELNNASHSVSLLLNDLLSWSISQQQGFKFSPQTLSLRESVNTCLDLFQDQLNYKRLKVENQIGSEQLVWVDQRALQAIIRNLVSNAIKFSHIDSIIRFANRLEENGLVSFSIIDQGVGMSAEQIDSLMNSATFVTHRGTANEKGSGLGMNLIKDFVNKSKGQLTINSESGVGTTVTISLPAVPN